MQVKLVVTNKASREVSEVDLTVEATVILGRHLGSPILLQGDGLSRHHCSLMLIEGVLAVEDLSSNGTWLNGALLKAQMTAPVKSGDVIEIPGYHMQVIVQSIDLPQNTQARIATPLIEPAAAPMPAWKRPLIAALSFFEPVETVLILLATATFALISFYLNR